MITCYVFASANYTGSKYDGTCKIHTKWVASPD
jgi:hypothetical protein